MAKVKTYAITDQQVGEAELKSAVFQQASNPELLHFVVKDFMHQKRSCNAATKNRSAVAGGGAKPWRQKGTGRARAGTIRSPLWNGGGVIFGPNNMKRKMKVNRKVKRKALLGALADSLSKTILVTQDDGFNAKITKVKDFVNVLTDLGINSEKVLYVSNTISDREPFIRNIKNVKISSVYGLNVYDLLNARVLMVEDSAVKKLEEIYK